MTAVDHGRTAVLFVTNVLNGTVAAKGEVVKRGTVVRLELSLPSNGQATRGEQPRDRDGLSRAHRSGGADRRSDRGRDGPHGTLYVADSAANRVAAVPQAMTRMSALGGGGMTVSTQGSLNDPLGLMIAPNGDVVTANGGDGKFVETSPAGTQVAVKNLIPNGGGDLFGLALAPSHRGIYFVDDAGSGRTANSLRLLH